ncbi:unnamed protein product [Meloidogyne enterolobii]|uniref:Uncharacterized protein n=1 Tax=Meloidogyne enterolobii TaxID=390850 RepID=A0ACB0YSA0_MELEN
MSSLINFVFLLFCQLPFVNLFNLDTEYPIYKFGSPNSWFGFSVAAHFRSDGPSILVGAPKWTSGQPGTLKSGAVYACKPDSSNGNQCQLLSIEYLNLQDAKKPPNLLHGKHLHAEGKNGQLLGFSVYSSGMREEESSKALVCAPLLRWGQNAYTDGLLNFLWGVLWVFSILMGFSPIMFFPKNLFFNYAKISSIRKFCPQKLSA